MVKNISNTNKTERQKMVCNGNADIMIHKYQALIFSSQFHMRSMCFLFELLFIPKRLESVPTLQLREHFNLQQQIQF